MYKRQRVRGMRAPIAVDNAVIEMLITEANNARNQIAKPTDYLRDLAARCLKMSPAAVDDGLDWINEEIREVLAEVGASPAAPGCPLA